jgi:uncharacterized protein YqjF (DUF2071 family)
MIDRVAPTRRPPGPVRGYQRWRDLLFVHWPVPVAAVRELVPKGLELDLWDGIAYVGVVPFAMFGVRPRWAPEAVAFDFLETNVRTYVHVGGRDPGVYFFSLDAESRIAVAAARTFWGLPYFFSKMQLSKNGDQIGYQLERLSGDRPRLSVRYELGELLGPSKPGTLEHFLAERYFLHLERGGRIWSGQVHHAPYPLQRAQLSECSDQLIHAAGLPQPEGPPPLVHYASGVDVEIFDLAPRADE